MALTLAILTYVFPKGVYKKRSVNLFQLSLLLNLFVLCIFYYFKRAVKNFGSNKHLTQISILIAFLSLFIFLLVDNSKKIKNRLMNLKEWCCVIANEQRMDQLQQQRNHVTYTEVSASPEGSNEHSPLIPDQLLPPVVHFDSQKEGN